MSDERTRRERRVPADEEDHPELVAVQAIDRFELGPYGLASEHYVPVAKLVGEDSLGHDTTEDMAPDKNPKKIALFVSSTIAAIGIVCVAVGLLSLCSVLTTGDPFPGVLWYTEYGPIPYSDFLIVGSIEMITFGLILSIVFGMLSVSNLRKTRMIKRMPTHLKRRSLGRRNEWNDH